jgi:hypothetical protein
VIRAKACLTSGIPLAKFVLLLLAEAMFLTAGPLVIAPFATTLDGVQTTGTIQNSIDYTFLGKAWTNRNDPLTYVSATTLSGESENQYLHALSDYGHGWTYTFSDLTLAPDSFLVQTYDVQGPTPPAKNGDAFVAAADTAGGPFYENCVTFNSCVGTEFQVAYDASEDDPVNDLHWIQVVYDNFTSDREYIVDNRGSQVSPYYPGAADESGFLDIPGIQDAADSHFFNAELYLVSGPPADSPGQVTIYGAIDWGWQNNPVPEPATYLLAVTGFATVACVQRRRVAVRRSNEKKT